MAHIDTERQRTEVLSYPLSRFLPPEESDGSFCIFCGDERRRDDAALYAVSRSCGRRGVVLLHNSPGFEARLGELTAGGASRFRSFFANRPAPSGSPQDSFFYDPLYGLDKERAVNAIVPLSESSPAYPAQIDLQAHVRAYLSAMEELFALRPETFGDYPFNLDLLAMLTAMPYATLERRVLRDLPPERYRQLAAALSGKDVQRQAAAAVEHFAGNMRRSLWVPRQAAHTRLSVIKAVEDRCLISIYLPAPEPAVLDYIAYELESLVWRKIPFLLVDCGADLRGSSRLFSYFTAQRSPESYSAGISAPDVESVLGAGADDKALGSLLERNGRTVVLRCANTAVAEPFSRLCGTYYRTYRLWQRTQNRLPWHLFSSHESGVSEQQQETPNVRAEELTALNGGALLLDGAGGHSGGRRILAHNLRIG